MLEKIQEMIAEALGIEQEKVGDVVKYIEQNQ